MGLIGRLWGERGQALVLAALCMPLLLGFMGFALDVGMLSIDKRKLQAAADSAAMAGAAELNYGDYASAAEAAAVLNGFTNGSNGITVSVNPSGTTVPSPLYGAYKGQSGYLEVIVSQSEPTYFMKIFHWNSMTVAARAVAALGSTQNCIYALASSGTSITLNNNAQLTAPGCGIVVNSSSSSAISVSGSANVTAGSVSVVGGSYTDNSGSKISPAAMTGITAVNDPLGFLEPPSYSASDCGSDPLTHYGNGGSSYIVGPGAAYSTTQNSNTVCYSSLSLGVNNDTVTLNPGVYVITGALTFASGKTLGGDGVTFYLCGNASVNIGNGAMLNFTAPTSGSYNGVLFYQDRADTQPASIQGGANSTLTGILYFPSAALTIGNGSCTMASISAPIVANTITMVGGSTLQDNSYSNVNSSSLLSSPKLVE